MRLKTAFCFDFDGTLTRTEVLPQLARDLGIEPEMAALTQATLAGVLPFDASFRLRCRLLKDLPVSRAASTVGAIALFDKLITFIQSEPGACVITGNLDAWVMPTFKALGIAAHCSTAHVNGDQLLGVAQVLNKGHVVAQLRHRFDRVVAVGDGMGDVDMFEQADLRIAFSGVHAPVPALVERADILCNSESALLHVLRKLPA